MSNRDRRSFLSAARHSQCAAVHEGQTAAQRESRNRHRLTAEARRSGRGAAKTSAEDGLRVRVGRPTAQQTGHQAQRDRSR